VHGKNPFYIPAHRAESKVNFGIILQDLKEGNISLSLRHVTCETWAVRSHVDG
jgi:hypothetical protein